MVQFFYTKPLLQKLTLSIFAHRPQFDCGTFYLSMPRHSDIVYGYNGNINNKKK